MHLPPRLRTRLVLAAILCLALFVRLGHLAAVHDKPFFARLAMDSQEYDRWAQEVAAGTWLADEPFFQAPLYPYLLAVLYRLFGHHLVLVYLLQIGLATVGLYALYRAGNILAGEESGLAAAALGAFYGPFLFYDVQLLKESLAVTLVAALLWALVTAWNRDGPGSKVWLGAGALAGLLTLLRENTLLVLPFLVALALCDLARPWRRRFAGAGLLVVGFALPLITPALHNARAGGGFLPTTFQGGVNFYIGNNPRADGTYHPISPGKQIPYYEREEPTRLAEQELGRPLSGAEVSRFWWQKALAWGVEHPGAFLLLQVRKVGIFFEAYERPDAVDYYWTREISPVLGLPLFEWGAVVLLAFLGLWEIRQRLRVWAPVLVFAVAWIASTVIFFLFSRYRLPVVPAFLLLAAVPVAELVRFACCTAQGGADRGGGERPRPGRGRSLGIAAFVILAWALPHAFGHEPRLDLVHYNLGRLHDEAGESEEAVRHYLEALAIDPDDFLACLNLGNGLARSGRMEEAREWYRKAVEIQPRFDDGWANLGTVELALGHLTAAREALDRALDLNSQNSSALHSRALLALRLGDLETARAFNERLLELVPDHSAGRHLAGRLSRSRPQVP